MIIGKSLNKDYTSIQSDHFFSNNEEKTKLNWFAFELASEIDRAVPFKLKKYLSRRDSDLVNMCPKRCHFVDSLMMDFTVARVWKRQHFL
jgi:hypothetical protein